MPKFSEIVDLLQADFEARESFELVRWNVGELKLQEQRAPRDIVFVSSGGKFDLPNPHAGPTAYGDTEVGSLLMNRVVNFVCYVWGKDQDDAEAMLEAIARTLDRVLGQREHKLGDYDAVTEMGENAGYTWHGFTYAIQGTMRLVLPREASPTVLITSHETPGTYEEAAE